MYKTLTTFTRALSRRTAFSLCPAVAAGRENHFRSMSVILPPPVTSVITGALVSKDELGNFMAVFPDIVKDLTDTSLQLNKPDVTKWLENLLQYNVPGGKNNRGLILVSSFKMLSSPSYLTDENLRLSYILGWCVEILQAYQLVMDDLMDNAITRRGRPCWYRHNDVGLMAVNDGILLEQAIYQLLKKYFKDKPYYTHILELFYDVTMKSAMGQCLDMLTAKSFKSKKLEKYTMENYKAIVKYKTAYYSFVLPVCLAMRMTNVNDQEIFRQAKVILLDMGQFFQIQDDYLDCYGNPEITGKIGTDIEDGKCSWLAVKALQKVTTEQKKIMEDNYGIDDQFNVAVIKDLYQQLKLQNTFLLYEEESYNLIRTCIQNFSPGLSQDMFFKLLEKIYKRTL
ncbi:farnesyl pyrophosphate synthase-like [Myzus persicae]|uniref:Farnesyl pyrophosphate synthase n=1 Tax=Myzus persicae TaxID=13164 RepID=A9Z1D4_MYZPE|nr:farnesyl pyrophosphate synthase-like [Myzus persicae]ABY19313.1 farnesyl diphosphate synthase 2 [Myzus persicae]ACA35007.1 putative mitochondrial isoprenyl diphosphate synthase precursor [Myzus persicae]ACA48700.1 farnesyl diphosphate synthase 2 [Myzus persicae]